jgi:hypothetical protein
MLGRLPRTDGAQSTRVLTRRKRAGGEKVRTRAPYVKLKPARSMTSSMHRMGS